MEQLFYLGFALFPGVGPAKFQSLLRQFHSAECAWHASVEDLTEVIGDKLAGELGDFRKRFAPQKYAKELEEKEIGWVTLVDEEYPRLLKNITNPSVISSENEKSQSINTEGFWSNQNESLDLDSSLMAQNDSSEIAANSTSSRNDKVGRSAKKHHPPFVIFYKGNSQLFDAPKSIGIVGTRSISQYGREVTEMLTRELVEQDFVIVSGLALGVDGVAHQTCLNNQGRTIAVLGSGVDVCTPSNHQVLYDKILAQEGLIVSTVPPGEEPNKGSFPARNKIIAGLALGVIVTEGTADSGALYTADFAKDMGRPVFSVPGPITSRLSAATTKLLKNNAVLVTSGQDVVDKLGIMKKVKTHNAAAKSLKGDSPEEQKILDLLQFEPLHFNEIVRKIGKDSKGLGSLLSLMELKGIVKCNSQSEYSLNF